MLRISALIVSLGFALLQPLAFAESPSDSEIQQTCQTKLEEHKSKALQSLSRFENAYVQMNWKFKQSWEIRYVPLWDAEQKKLDEFSTDRQAEGEMLATRYQTEAQSSEDAAREDLETAYNELSNFQKEVLQMGPCCQAWAYENCIHFATDKLLSQYESFKTHLMRVEKAQNAITAKVKKFVSDSVSDHVSYGNRMYSELQVWHTTFEPEFFRLEREAKEILELRMPKSDCCSQCTAATIKLSRDSKFDPLDADRSFQRGINRTIYDEEAVGTGVLALRKSGRKKKLED